MTVSPQNHHGYGVEVFTGILHQFSCILSLPSRTGWNMGQEEIS